MRNSCLQQSPPATSSAGVLLFQQESRRRSWSPTSVHLGARSAPPGLLAELWLPRAPVTRFPDKGHQHKVAPQHTAAPQPRSFSLVAARLQRRPSCPSRLRGGRRARPARPGESRAQAARRPGALACARRAVRPARKRGPGAPPLSRVGLGSPRGDRAPERALFAALATLHTSFQPQPPPPRASRGPCLFFQP